MAFYWRWKWDWMMSILLLLAFSVGVCEGCLNVEREALLKIKDDINSPNGSSLSYWEGDDCCQWYEVTCDKSTGRVSGIYLIGEREEQMGTWYPNASLFAQLEELSNLTLAGNQIGGWKMPQALRNLTRLRFLDLEQNVLENDQFYLHGLTMLEYLYLTEHRLQGNFITKSGICELTSLQYLDLSGNRLDDPNIPLCLANLTKLQSLNISGNGIRGNFFSTSGLCKLVALEDLDLSDNNFDDQKLPICLGNLTKLYRLDLSGNNLSGNLLNLTGLCELRALRFLSLSSNALEGIIPPCIANMCSLQDLDLSHNNLNGCISWLGNLSSLRIINLEYNNFDGVLEFSTMANLSNLVEVSFSNNPRLQLETESPTWIPSFQLSILDLSNCQLNTRSGGSVPNFLTNQSQLEDLDLSRNNLRGSIPSWLILNWTYGMTCEGPVPCMSTHPYTRTSRYKRGRSSLKLNDNSFTGPFPLLSTENTTGLDYLDISENKIEGLLPSMLLLQLSYLNMSGNALQGITTFQSDNNEPSNLKVLDLSSNEFSRELPMELFEKGVSLEYLGLSNNHLHFDTTPSFSNMMRLEVLLLDKNAFTEMKIFQGLANISSLQVLDIRENSFTGIVPSWLSTLSKLTSLLLGGNNFVGHIPAELCQMQQLRLLDFSHNELSGDIPPCFNNISAWINHGALDPDRTSHAIDYNLRTISKGVLNTNKPGRPSHAIDYNLRTTFTTKGRELTYEGTPLLLMIGIDFSSNKLMGKIPLEIGYLKEIKSLNLSHNLLTGDIPKTFQCLKNIESLDLSNNKLTGHIPMELTQLYSLSAFNVAFNNLSGMIPYSKGQFSTFNESIYEGNPDLCGQPLKRNCSPSPPTKPLVEQSKENDESMVADNPLFFYSCVLIGYALGFWGCIALLYICKSWRMTLFSVVDRFF